MMPTRPSSSKRGVMSLIAIAVGASGQGAARQRQHALAGIGRRIHACVPGRGVERLAPPSSTHSASTRSGAPLSR
jgi:hypothetical protein